MAHFKHVKVRAIYWCLGGRKLGYWWQWRTFTTFIDDNGNKTYTVDGKEVTKDEGNAEYLRVKKLNAEYQQTKDCADFIARDKKTYEKLSRDYRRRGQTYDASHLVLKPSDTYKQTVEEYDITYEQMIENLRNSIDEYTMYIDDYGQQKEAEAHNRSIRERIKEIEKLIAERK